VVALLIDFNQKRRSHSPDSDSSSDYEPEREGDSDAEKENKKKSHKVIVAAPFLRRLRDLWYPRVYV
jgi:hypothetical protein